jgi:hypothetical protein
MGRQRFINIRMVCLLAAGAMGFAIWPAAISHAADAPDGPATQPAHSAWIDKNPAQWPQLLLTNDAHFKDNSEMVGASGFIMILPDGTNVAATARHVLMDIKLADVEKKINSWTMSPPTMAQKKVYLSGLAIDPVKGEMYDWLLLTPANANGPFPSMPLPARAEPVKVGDTVYVVGISLGDKSAQEVFKGKVVSQDGNQFFYELPQVVETQGFSGSPVIDQDGQVVGIHIGKLSVQPEPGKTIAAAQNTADVLKELKVSPNAKGPLVTTPPPPPAPASRPAPALTAKIPVKVVPFEDPTAPATQPALAGPATAPAPEISPEDKELRSAKVYFDNKVYDIARDKLQHIIDTYPNTPAADQAAQMLMQIPDQNQ